MSLVTSDDEEYEDDGYYGDFNSDDDDDDDSENPSTTPFISPTQNGRNSKVNHQSQFSVLGVVAAALRKSLVTCSVVADDVASDVDIDGQQTFATSPTLPSTGLMGFWAYQSSFSQMSLVNHPAPDFNERPSSPGHRKGLLSLVVWRLRVQTHTSSKCLRGILCSSDQRGNSVPTILLRMQTRLYSEGGLQAEGIFRINAENSQEENVRNQLNKGVVPHGIDVHCLAGLIKAWFRELPSGVLDSLTPEQVMHCNTEEECSMLVKLLPCTEAALLDWAINLMADVVQHQHHNKMNARNIAMVFAPNMTQTLIVKTLRERDESAGGTFFAECTDSFEKIEEGSNTTDEVVLHEQTIDDGCSCKEAASDDNLLRSSTLERLECDNNENPLSIIRSTKSYGECTLGRTSSPVMRKETNIRT
ncbi:hypothetical protein DH2020_029209 [Rehmannia glutinosa]|uniref:Rho-GAP domain-containing protein n=1 Tax=Rehmannia glutinosa TaxID=99300 RepID=A0ABR0VP84_REHGL